VARILKAMARLPQYSVVRWAWAALLSLGLCGCAGFWDKVTSREFQVSDLVGPKPNPLVVIAKSNDGDKRATAYAALREPKQYGGTDAEQDAVVLVLVAAARGDSQPLCRLSAIHTLGGFKDPRAVQGLIDAYFAVNETPRPAKALGRLDTLASNGNGIPQETANIIQVEALLALGRTKSPAPAVLELLTRVAEQPSSAVEVSEQEKRLVMDLRIAAVRALGSYSQYQSTDALLKVLQKDKDAALRDRAVESLELATGKKLGDDTKAWEDLLHNTASGDTALADKKKSSSILKLVSGP
jgi:HEAT repeat protein